MAGTRVGRSPSTWSPSPTVSLLCSLSEHLRTSAPQSQGHAAPSLGPFLSSLRCTSPPPSTRRFCLQPNTWAFLLLRHWHHTYPAHASPLGTLASLQAGLGDRTSTTLLVTAVKAPRPCPEHTVQRSRWLPARPAAPLPGSPAGLGSRQLPGTPALFLPDQADFSLS